MPLLATVLKSNILHDVDFLFFQLQFRCPDYMQEKQHEITPSMRAILVDWLVEVQESFELNHETLYTAVKLVDLYLSKVTFESVPKTQVRKA